MTISVKEAKKLVDHHSQPLHPVKIPLEKASGHALASDIYSKVDIPAFRQSSMDGYALMLDEKNLGWKLAGEMAAGTGISKSLQQGETFRIFTGAPVPDKADTVVMQEKITHHSGLIFISDDNIKRGDNIREIGSEIKAGALAMTKGSVLSPAAIGFLAGIGQNEVEVFPYPKLCIITTGNELIESGAELTFGQIYDSNSYSLSSALKAEGLSEISLLKVEDNLEMLTRVLKDALLENDIILLTGGVSVGDYDFVSKAASQCDVETIFHGIRQKPGKPLFFGTKGRKLIFGLPGNPSSVLNCYYNYVLPAVKHLSAKANSVREITAELDGDFSKTKGIAQFLKGTFDNGFASPLGAQESFRLSSFAVANCLIFLDEDRDEFISGERVQVFLLP